MALCVLQNIIFFSVNSLVMGVQEEYSCISGIMPISQRWNCAKCGKWYGGIDLQSAV